MTLRSYLRIFRERFRVVAFVTVLCVAIAVLITALTPKSYESDVQIFVTPNGVASSPSDQYNGQASVLSQVSTFAALIHAKPILDAIRSDEKFPAESVLPDSSLAAKIAATAPSQQTLVIVSATDSDPNRAAAIANSAARAFVSYIQDKTTPTDSTKSTVRLFSTNDAVAASSPISPKPSLNIALGVILGLLLGAALAVARDVLDNRIKTVEVLSKVASAPAMGVIVHDPTASTHPIAGRAGNRNARAENFRLLRANLQFADVDQHPRAIAVTSSVPGEGKSMVAMNLASTLAEAGFTVCLVDADLRRPTVAKSLGLANPVGLTSVLIQQITLPEALQAVGKNLYVLASGPLPPNPSEVLASSYVREVVRSLLDMVDYVILDSAPLLPVADGAEVAALAEGTLLVARSKITTDAEVRRSLEALRLVNARLVGVVLNGVPAKRSSEYGYGYGHGYYRDTPARPKSARAADTSESTRTSPEPTDQVGR